VANWLDKTIAYLAPELGLRRLRARAGFEIMRNYEAATSSKSTAWKTAGTSANAASDAALSKVRNNARDLIRNNPYASRAAEIFTAKAIGTGIRARFPKGAEKAFRAWSKRCDFDEQLDLYGLQSLAGRTAFESGEVLVKRVWTRDEKDVAPIRLQLLEPDYVDSTRWGRNGENLILAGVEIDRRGRRVAYWLYDSHPGEVALVPKYLQSRRVDAADILHFYEKRRPGQMRAVSRLAASIMRLRHLDEYQEAEIVRKKIEACFVAFVHGGTSSRPIGEGELDAETGKRSETVSPGMIEYLTQGESVTFGTPSASQGYGDYTAAELHAIAVGAGLTYEQLTGNLEGVTFSSIRAGMQDFRDLIEQYRWIYFVPMFCNRIEEWFLEAAWTAGLIRSRNYEAIWTPPRWRYIEPLKDVQAIKEEIKAGLTSTPAVIRERGEDPEEVLEEIVEDRERRKKKGVAVDTDPGAAAAASSSATNPDAETDEETAEPKKKGDEE
jgi:lambda family phage portal protein